MLAFKIKSIVIVELNVLGTYSLYGMDIIIIIFIRVKMNIMIQENKVYFKVKFILFESELYTSRYCK